jgi:hypothetical protein
MGGIPQENGEVVIESRHEAQRLWCRGRIWPRDRRNAVAKTSAGRVGSGMCIEFDICLAGIGLVAHVFRLFPATLQILETQ